MMGFFLMLLVAWAAATLVALALMLLMWPRRWRGLRVWRMVRVGLWVRRR